MAILSVQAGNDGAGNLNISAGRTFISNNLTLRAGDGSGGGTAATVDLTNAPDFFGAAGAGTSPTNFTLRQDAALADGGIPEALWFGNGVAGMSLTLQSDNSSVTVDTPSKVNGANLNISAADGVTINGALTLTALALAGDSDGDNSGNVVLGGAVDTGGGAFSSTGVGFDTTGVPISTGGGNLTVNHSGTVLIASSLSSQGGKCALGGGNRKQRG